MGCGSSKTRADGTTKPVSDATAPVAAPAHQGGPPPPQEQEGAHAEGDDGHGVSADMWSGILERMKPTVLAHGSVKSAIVIGAGASGLECARKLQAKGVAVTILEGRDRVGGRLYTDPDGLDIGGHWIHGGGPDENVPDYAPDKIGQLQLNPVRKLCDELGIETKLTDGDSSYICESEGGVRQIAFYRSDGSLMENDGEEEEELWACYETLMAKVHDLEDEMRSKGRPEGDMSLMDAIEQAKAALASPLTERQSKFCQWHFETEFGGDYAEDAHNLSFFHYDGGAAGEYRAFPGGDRILVGGYSALINKLAEPLMACVQTSKVVTAVERSDSGIVVRCADGSEACADVAVVTLPLGILKRPQGEPGHVAFSPPLPPSKTGAIGRGRMACLNKLFLIFDQCYWPKDQYTFSYINDTPDEFPSMIVNVYVSHGLPILTCMVGGGAGRQMETRPLDDNVAWGMQLVRKLFGASVPEPTKAVMTAWDQDPFSYGSYSCMGKGMQENDMSTLAEPVDGRLFFAGEHTMPIFWGCVHGALVSGVREAARITGDLSLLPTGMATQGKRQAKAQKIGGKKAAVQAKWASKIGSLAQGITKAASDAAEGLTKAT